MSGKKQYWKSLQLQKGKIVSGYDQSPWIVSEWREVPPPPRSCEGLNCCENIIDAMGYVNMEILAEVEIEGKQIIDDDKITAQRMRIIHAWKWEKKDSVSMAIYSAELCLEHFEKIYPNDKRPREAIEAAKRWIENPTEENGSAARLAARSARLAARSAWSAESAARSAWSAAMLAARLAARSAWSAESAAMLAESAAMLAESAARSAAGSAESAAGSAESADIEKARTTMKKKIHTWIVKRTKELIEMEV